MVLGILCGAVMIPGGAFAAAPAAAAAKAAGQPKAAPATPPASVAVQAPASGVDLAVLDTSASPCADFYQFACGDWLADAPTLPPSGGASRLGDVGVKGRQQVQALLAAAARDDAARSPAARKVGDFYASCMDQAAIQARGLAPLAPELDRIAALRDRSELPALAARLHQLGAGVFFTFGTQGNATSGGLLTGVLSPGGMGLPDPQLYFGNDRRSLEVRGRYLAHVTRMLELLGDDPAQAEASARSVVQIESRLARAALAALAAPAAPAATSPNQPADQQPPRLYHKLTRQQLAALAPAFGWDTYFNALGAPAMPRLVVGEPDFFKALNQELVATGIDRWKSYLRWHLVQSSAEMLPKAFGAENEAFFARMLGGGRQLPPRSQVCATMTGVQLGEELGRLYVEKTSSPEARTRALGLVEAVERALAADLAELTWMSEETRGAALAKLHAVRNKVGYPGHWHADSGLQIVRGDALGNWQRSHAFAFQLQLARLGKPPDPDEWQLPPASASAAYLPMSNEIEVPAGMLQAPVFDPRRDAAANFGVAGSFIGHELIHGFDDEGRQYDAHGRLADWWTAAEERQFERRAACFVDQASELGFAGPRNEDVAEAAGVRLAFDAYVASLGGQPRRKLDGFTPEQRFFLSFAQAQCTRERETLEEEEEMPSRFRVDGTLSNMPEFLQAFSCKAGEPMVHAPVCRVF